MRAQARHIHTHPFVRAFAFTFTLWVFRMISQRREKREEGKPLLAPARWYVVETNNHAEREAKFHLERKHLIAYLPMRKSLSKRTDVMTATPLFPNYLFAQVDDDAWGDVFGLLGVRSVLGYPPEAAPRGLVERIKQREISELGQKIVQLSKPKVTTSYVAGDVLRVKQGAWTGWEAVFQEPVDSRRVIILLNLFGRETPWTVDADMVSKAS